MAWYSENVADPVTSDEAYGYWVFVVGTLLAAAGLLVYLVSTTAESGTDAFWLYRSLSFSLAAIGIPVIMDGFIVVMPLDDRATRITFFGLAISLLSVLGFLWAYPSNWNVDQADYSAPIILVYSIELAIQALTAVLYPSTTSGKMSRKYLQAQEQPAEDDANETSKATFELYRDRSSECRWRLRPDNGNVIADSSEGCSSKAKAKQGLESVRTNVPGALVEEADSGNSHAEAAETVDDADAVVSMDEESVEADAEAEASAGTFEVFQGRAGK